MKLIDTETSSLKEKYIYSLVEGSFVLGNLDLVGWVIIKNSFKSQKISMQPLKKLKDLRDFKKKRWTEEDNIWKLFPNSYKGERFTTGTISVKSFKIFLTLTHE